MLWGTIGILLVAVLIVKASGGAIPGITRGGKARRERPRDGGDSTYSPPLIVAGDSGTTATCDTGDGGWSDGDSDCGSDGGSDGGGDSGGDGGGGGSD